MDENRNPNEDSREEWTERRSGSSGAFWVGTLAFLVVLGAAAVTISYSYRQRSVIDQLAAHETDMNSTISQLQGQLDTATTKLNDISSEQAAAKAAAATAAAQPAARAASTAASRAEANRLKQLQSQVDDQQKTLQTTQDDVAKTRSDLQDSVSSTRDELNGNIAKTHDELVALEKQGERDYVEFNLAKSNHFQRAGTLSLSLRRADPKHANLDMMVLVNDKQIAKKKVNLYEPIWIYDTKGMPTQVVVNEIDKNAVKGYISAPKYTAADLILPVPVSSPPVGAKPENTPATPAPAPPEQTDESGNPVD